MSRSEELQLDGGSETGSAEPIWDGDSTAWIASLCFHLLILMLLAVASLVLPTQSELVLTYEPVDLVEEESIPQEFFSSDDPASELGALSQAGDASASAAATELDERSLVVMELQPTTDYGELVLVDVSDPSFQGPNLTELLPVQGVGSVGTSGATGAIDRITHEIITSLESRQTLVVWLFDQSGSMRAEREMLLKRFERIYDELGAIEAADNPAFARHKDKPLLTAVIGFGAEPRLLTPEPTDRLEEIEQAIRSITDDSSRQENVFQAVAMAAEKYRVYRQASQGRRNVMLIVFTDEAGDDLHELDSSVDLCRTLAMPVYVVGRPAPFGRQLAYVKWIDPDPSFDQRPQWVPVNLGPESMLPERLKLRFLGSGTYDALLDSGFGPYALTRLCYETGGLYFSAHPNREVGRSISGGETDNLSAHFTKFFDADVMRRYQPDYVPVQEYQHLLQSNRARRALVEAARLSWTSPMEDVRLRFPKRDEASLAGILTTAQRAAAFLQPKIDQVCQILLEGEADREQLRSPRWKAGYDLALGRALATQIRTAGYNSMLALAKQGMPFQKEENNTWVLTADDSYATSSIEKLAGKAREILERVEEEHAETPWAWLAQRELRTPLGWRWREAYTNLPPLDNQPNNARPNRPRREPNRPARPPRRNPPPL